MTSPHPHSPRTRVTRRQVVRAAWAAPVVVVVSAAPAMAASGPAVLDVEGGPGARNGAALPASYTISNLNTQATTALVVTVTLSGQGTPPSATSGVFTSSTTTTPTGFTVVTPTTPGTTFTFKAVSQLAGGGSIPFDLSITLAPLPGDGIILIDANPGTTGSASINSSPF